MSAEQALETMTPEQRADYARGPYWTDLVHVGDTIAWQNGLGGTETEVVFRSRRTGRLAVRGAFNGEMSVWSIATVNNGHRIIGRAS